MQELESLDQKQALLFFRDTLWAEALNAQISKSLVLIPECINVGDGGIDAYLKDVNPPAESWIDRGTTGFQVKAGDLPPAECRKELHEGKDLAKPIKRKIREILEGGGTYTVVCFKDLVGTPQVEERLKALKEELAKEGIPNEKVKFYPLAQIKAFAEKYPALVMMHNSSTGYAVHYASWAQNKQIKNPQTFILDEQREKLISELREKIRQNSDETKIIRICGVAGIGKTRFTFELLKEDDLRSQTLYVQNGDDFLAQPLWQTIKNNNNLSGILVVDDLDIKKHRIIEDAFSSNQNGNLTIITLSTDCSPISPPTFFLRLDKLHEDQIKKLLETENPSLASMVVERIARFADGYPRFAILLAEKYHQADTGKDEFIIGSNDRDLFEKLIAGEHLVGSENYAKTKKVLMGLSLFSRVGSKSTVKSEAEWLTQYLEISTSDFNSVVREQKERGLIQGNHYISITPAILSIWLLNEWWAINGFTDPESFSDFVQKIPEPIRKEMLKHFADNLRYIGANEIGLELSRHILKPDGIIDEINGLDHNLGKTFFLSLTEANPKAALDYIKSKVTEKTFEELKADKQNRRMMVWALEMIVVWEELFDDAMDALLKLSVAENESCSNNATGIFTSLYSTVYAPTQKKYEARLELLKRIMSSGVTEEIMIGIKACDTAFSTTATRFMGSEQQGLKKDIVFYRPETWKELIEIHKTCWDLLLNVFKTTQDKEIKEASLQVIINNSRTLLPSPDLAPLVLKTFEEILKEKTYKKDILAQIISTLHYDGDELPPDIVSKLEIMRDSVTDESYESQLHRYVGMDLLEDRVNRKVGYVDEGKNRISNLAKEMVEKPDLFDAHTEWLISNDALKGHQFGYELARYDTNLLFLDKVLDLVPTAESLMFVCGYLSFLFENQKGKWETVIQNIYENEEIKIRLPEIIFRSGVNDNVFPFLLKLIAEGKVEIRQLWWFTYGLSLTPISEPIFLVWVKTLLDLKQKEATIIAMSTYSYYFLHKENKEEKPLPKEQTFALLTDPTLLTDAGKNIYQMEGFYWKEIADAFVDNYPEMGVQLAEKLILSLNEEETFVDHNEDDITSVLYKIANGYPNEVWQIVKKYLGPPLDKRSFVLREWLKGGSFMSRRNGGPALNLFEPNDFWSWVDEDIEKRAWYAGNLIPKWLSHDTQTYCWAKELLKRYGDRDDVRRNFSANYSTEGWSGPASLHYSNKKQALEEYAKTETDKNVLRWIREYIEGLDQQIERATIEEEDRGF